jgi:hypothetical protein
VISGDAPFKTSLRIAGDARLMLSAIQRHPPEFVPVLIDKMPIGGTSSRLGNALLTAREIASINREYGLHAPFIHAFVQRLELAGSIVLAKFFSEHSQHRVADWYRSVLGKPKKWTIE